MEDAQTYQEFFTAVKKRVPGANVTILMTDDGKYESVIYFALSTFFLDSAIVAACSAVYPGVNHLLCRWHIDRYDACSFVAITHTHNHVACRAWQRKLHSLVTDDAHKAEIYKYLWMLLTEGDKQVFSENLRSFLQYWESREPKFTSYFRQNYVSRYGKKHCTGESC